jgi:hypothetical protein
MVLPDYDANLPASPPICAMIAGCPPPWFGSAATLVFGMSLFSAGM